MRHIYACPHNPGIDCTTKPCHERCFNCGYNPIEEARRIGYIQAGGMKADSDGLHRLHLKVESAVRI